MQRPSTCLDRMLNIKGKGSNERQSNDKSCFENKTFSNSTLAKNDWTLTPASNQKARQQRKKMLREQSSKKKRWKEGQERPTPRRNSITFVFHNRLQFIIFAVGQRQFVFVLKVDHPKFRKSRARACPKGRFFCGYVEKGKKEEEKRKRKGILILLFQLNLLHLQGGGSSIWRKINWLIQKSGIRRFLAAAHTATRSARFNQLNGIGAT